MSDSTKQRFGGVARLHGENGMQKLIDSHVCIIGVGGVGSWVAEVLARSGVGEITLVDADDICVTNINRQIHALTESIGQEKVAVMAQRIKSINPNCQVNQETTFFLESTAEKLLKPNYDFVIDAIDSIKHKCLLIALCKEKDINILTLGGAGGKKQIKDIQLCDLGLTYGDRLLSKVRATLRKNYNFPKYKDKKFKVMSVFSPEAVKMPWCDLPEGEQRTSLKLDCNNGFGTDMTVISIFGITAAHYVINQILDKP
ncbi:MAG: ThiF family adenylyltransferase [Marinicellaceae bacterium]